MRVSPFEFEAPAPSGAPPGHDALEASTVGATPAAASGDADDRDRQPESLDEPGYGHGV